MGWYDFFLFAFCVDIIVDWPGTVSLHEAICLRHDDVTKWKHFPRYWPFVRGIHRSTVNSPHKGQWRGALVFFLICASINGCVNNSEAGDLRRPSRPLWRQCNEFRCWLRTGGAEPSQILMLTHDAVPFLIIIYLEHPFEEVVKCSELPRGYKITCCNVIIYVNHSLSKTVFSNQTATPQVGTLIHMFYISVKRREYWHVNNIYCK